jgi:serine/threonine protein phosphatase PrpC
VLSLESVEVAFEAAFQAATMRVESSGFGCGATAVIAYVVGDVVYFAHAGDARAIVVTADEVRLATRDHKPESPEETARIVSSGGYVSETGRVNGTLGVARAIGDCAQQPSVTCTPDVDRYDTQGEPVALVLACDGVFDVMSNEQVAEIVRAEAVPHRAAVHVRDVAYALGSSDNISVIVVFLNRFGRTDPPGPPTIVLPSLSPPSTPGIDRSSSELSPPSSPTGRPRRRRARRRSLLTESAPSLSRSPARSAPSPSTLHAPPCPGSPVVGSNRRRRKKGRSRTEAEGVKGDV